MVVVVAHPSAMATRQRRDRFQPLPSEHWRVLLQWIAEMELQMGCFGGCEHACRPLRKACRVHGRAATKMPISCGRVLGHAGAAN